MPRPGTLLRAIGVAFLIAVAGLALWLLPLFTGAAIPAGATRLHIETESPKLTLGCPASLLAPFRIERSGDHLIAISIETGERIEIVWPSGFASWSIDGRDVLAEPWGKVVARDGDVLDDVGGWSNGDGTLAVCPLGIRVRGP